MAAVCEGVSILLGRWLRGFDFALNAEVARLSPSPSPSSDGRSDDGLPPAPSPVSSALPSSQSRLTAAVLERLGLLAPLLAPPSCCSRASRFAEASVSSPNFDNFLGALKACSAPSTPIDGFFRMTNPPSVSSNPSRVCSALAVAACSAASASAALSTWWESTVRACRESEACISEAT
jgi:hypothetical protein